MFFSSIKAKQGKRNKTMFDLRFFKLVDQILRTKEDHQPPATSRDRTLNKRYAVEESQNGAVTITVKDEDKLLRLYIKLSYPHYFGMDPLSERGYTFRSLVHGSDV